MAIRNIQVPKSISLFILICICLVFISMSANSKNNQMHLTSMPYLQQPPTPTPRPNCSVPPYPVAAYNQQPYPNEMAPYFDQVGLNQLGTAGPTLPTIDNASPYAPCILLKAIGYQESGWKHFDANFGDYGYTEIASSCDYGLMQIVSGMDGSNPNFEASRVNEEIPYNIGTGMLLLIEKWQTLKLASGGFDGGSYIVGDGNIKIVEDWYYSVWAYNGWGWRNNPNNNCEIIPWNPTDCVNQWDINRLPFDGTQDKRAYPYQELIWGYAAHPPEYDGTPFWQAMNLTLPDWANVGGVDDPHYPNQNLPRPEPHHGSCSVTYLPTILKYYPLPQDTYEPNNDFASAYTIVPNTVYASYIWSVDDIDWFKFDVSVPVGKERLVEVWLESIASGTDYDLAIYDSGGNKLDASAKWGNSDEYISRVATTNEPYYLEVYPFGGTYSHVDSYKLRVEIGAPAIPKRFSPQIGR